MVPLTGRNHVEARPNRNNFNYELGEKIAARVADYYGLNFEDILTGPRSDQLSWVRALGMDICSVAGLTHQTTCEIFQRDRSTVGHARKRVMAFCSIHKDLREDRKKLLAEFVEFK